MDDSNDSQFRPSRRNVLKATGASIAGLGGVLAAEPAAAHAKNVHRKMGRLSAQNMADQMNNSLDDYVDTIASKSDDPDEDPYDCPWYAPDDVCDYLDTIDQSWDHYLNTEHPDGTQGNADQQAANNADAAKSRVDGNDYLDAAIKTGRALHFFQDCGTMVHTGREAEQALDRDIHHDYESWVSNNWSNFFKDKADQTWPQDMSSKSDVKSWANTQAYMSHTWLQDQWYDIKNPGSYYNSTRDAQGYCMTDSAIYSNGAVEWIWQNG